MTQQQGELGVERLCELARISRAGYYRHWQQTTPAEVDVELRDQLQKICLAHRHYGYRRVGAELRRRGFLVNHKKLRRLMHEDNLLAVRKRKFVTTTYSQHHLPIFPNLAGWYQPEGPNHLWVADLTYIRYRDLVSMMSERGICPANSTIDKSSNAFAQMLALKSLRTAPVVIVASN
jgi:putative transposase